MLCSRLGDTWQIGTASIREDQLVASGLRFVHWRHASDNVDARKDPQNNPTVRVYQHLEDELYRAGAGNEAILALTTTRDGAQNLCNYFDITGKQANAETAVKVAGATAKHCIVIHGQSTFLSGDGQNIDFDQECFTHAALPTSPSLPAHSTCKECQVLCKYWLPSCMECKLYTLMKTGILLPTAPLTSRQSR